MADRLHDLHDVSTIAMREEIARRESQASQAAVRSLNNLTKQAAITAILACDHKFKSVTSER